ncbi:hypothetical protein [Virgisporangium aurantiacum]|uniref:Uncharacterized protein n=1 Tax=Virgisporangium aurantiacum TaxID=175570 RepID=A0A8J3ZJI4_9ACTN|nr:hypothetical protein [Virgisporangium aurantiacum]GIJ64102.1 hypothetical protein Vau01_116180 [Virgisporangium aurantiacum]
MVFHDEYQTAVDQLWEMAMFAAEEEWVARSAYDLDYPEWDTYIEGISTSLERVLRRLDFAAADGEPDAFDQMIKTFGQPTGNVFADNPRSPVRGDPTVWGHVAAAETDLNLVLANLPGTWQGDAAGAFRSLIAGAFPPTVAAQGAMICFLRGYLEAYRDVMKETRRTTIKILNAARDAFTPQSDNIGSFAFVLIGAAAVVLGAAATGGLAVFAAGVEAGAGVLASGQQGADRDRDESEIVIEGHLVEEIIASMDQRITELIGHLENEEADIETAIGLDLDTLGPGRHNIEMFQAEFNQDTDNPLDTYAGFAPGDPHDVLADCEALYQIGYVDMSSAAWHYDVAAFLLGLTTDNNEADAFGSWFTSSVGQWRSLCTAFTSRSLNHTRDKLIRYGTDLCEIAAHYAETDARNAEQVQQIFDDYVDRQAELADENMGNRPTMNSRAEAAAAGPARAGAW